MKEQIKCKKCGLLIDKDSELCPYCGYKQDLEDDKPIENIEVKQKEEKTKKNNLFFFESRCFDIPQKMSIALGLVGLLGINFIGTILGQIMLLINKYMMISSEATGYLNFACYLILFGILVIILKNYLGDILKEFKVAKNWGKGLLSGVALIFISSLVANIFNLFKQNVSVNNNEANINFITMQLPILSLVIFGIIGPICEEFTYRLGFFNAFNKKRWVAYLAICLLFGFIHFDFNTLFNFNSAAFLNEILNIPSYIVAGLVLCYSYERFGISSSIIAHSLNNVTSILLTIIATSLI